MGIVHSCAVVPPTVTETLVNKIVVMANRVTEIFLTACLEGQARIVGRILKKAALRKSWVAFKPSNLLDLNAEDESQRTGLILAAIANQPQIVALLLTR